ncbi:MAG: hypothetical protein HY973_04680 [Candidatus Kerfeldbacteria bacterium]|nr:hypothetical protein [Candidatus Kerfeldbacteria bacterium]
MKSFSTTIKVALLIGVFGVGLLATAAVWAKNGFLLMELSKLEEVLPILLFHSQLKSIDNNILTVDWRGQEYKVTVTPQTKLWRRNGKPANLNEFKPGNSLRLSGKRLGDNVIEARYIHNSSLEIGVKAIIGLIDKLDVEQGQFILQSSTHGLVTVKFNAGAKVIDQGNEKKFSSLINGQKVIVKGLYDRSQQLISPVQKIIIFPD